MTAGFALIIACLLMALMMLTLWLVYQKINDAGIIDVGWAAGFGILAVFYAFLSDGVLERRILVCIVALTWSLRLSLYLLFDRIILAKEEDGRYQKLRAQWGENTNKNLFYFFQFQGFLDVVLSISLIVPMYFAPAPVGIWDYAALLLFAISKVGETISDWQLSTFRRQEKNRGKTCRSGFWRYSRHPNYFFEWLHWFSYILFSVSSPYWILTLIAPTMMLYFIFNVTGIPPTEEQALKSRGDDYRRYQAETNAFIPWFPRSMENS